MWPFRKRAAKSRADSAENEDNAADLLRALIQSGTITKEQAMNVPAFAACVNKITETVSIIPFRLYRMKEGQLEEIRDDGRIKLLNDDTGDTLDGVQFKRAMVRDYLTGKGGYAYINRRGTRVKSIHYVQESEISFQYSPDPIFKDYDILVQGKQYKPFEFLKILRNTENGRSGRSIVSEDREIINVAYNTLLYEGTLVKTGGNKKGFIKSAGRLTQEAMDTLKKAWKNLYQNNTENIVVLNNGLDFKEASSTSVELQLNENKKSNSDEICKIFGVPPGMINGSATEQDRVLYIQYCIQPILQEFECALNRDLLLEREKGNCFFAADTTELTKGDITKRFQAYETASKNGFMQIDEIRLKENLPPLGLDFVRLGLQDVLYDPTTKSSFIPNMNQTGKINETTTEGGEENNEN